MTVTAAKLRAVVEADTSKGQAGLRAFGKEVTTTANTTRSGLGGIGSALGGLGGIAAGLGVAFSAAQVLKFGQDAVMAASAADESMNKMNVVFGASSGVIKAFSQNAAQDLGMSSQQAIEAAGTFGNLFTSMGLGQGESANLSRGIVQLAADLGSFNNIGTDLMLEKLRSGLVGEVEPLRAVGINIDAASVKAKALSMGLADANGAVSQAATLQARYALMLEQSKNAQGDFARTSGGLANSLKIAQGEVEDLKTQLGLLVIKPYTVVVHVLASGIGQLNTDLAAMSGDSAVRLPALQKQLDDYKRMLADMRGAGLEETSPYIVQVQGSIAALTTELNGAKTNMELAGDAGVSAAMRTAAAMYAANTASSSWGDAGVGAANRIGAAAEAAALRIAAITGYDNSNRAPLAPALGTGTDLGAQLLAAQASSQYVTQLTAREVQDRYNKGLDASTRIADDYAAKMKAANAAIASDLKGEMTAGMDTAIGLLDLRGPDAKDPNGPFRDMYRVLDVAKLGNASPWQQGLGIDQAQATEIGAKFEKGIWDDTVTKFIDVEALKKSVKDKQLGQAFMDAFAESLAAGGTGTDGKKKAGVGATVIPTMLSSIDAQLVTDGKKFGAKGEAAYDLIEGGFLDKAKKSTAFVSMVDAMVDNSLGRYTN